MSTIVLGKNGVVSTKEWVYDEEKEEGSYVIEEVALDDIFPSLQYHIEEIEEGYTLRDYFRMITKYETLILLDRFFPSFLKEYVDSPLDGCVSKEISNLLLQRLITIELDKEKKITDFQNYISFDGEGVNPDSPRWAIEFSPLSELLDIPMKIEKTVVYITTFEGYKVVDNISYAGEDFMTLYDFVHNVIWELSFTGTPTSRDNKNAEMKEMVDEIHSGEAKLVPWEELQDKLGLEEVV